MNHSLNYNNLVAGLSRLGMGDRIEQVLPDELCLHAVGQGALGIECREDDKELLDILQAIHSEETESACEAERAFLRETEGGCQVPVGVRTLISGQTLSLKGIILSIDGTKSIDGEISGHVKDAKSLGKQLADSLKSQGATQILKEVFEANNKK